MGIQDAEQLMSLKIRELTSGPDINQGLKEIARVRQPVTLRSRKLLHDLEDARAYYPLNRINFDSKKLGAFACDGSRIEEIDLAGIEQVNDAFLFTLLQRMMNSDKSKTADEGHLLLCLLAEVNLTSCVHVTNWGVKWLLDSIVPVATTAFCRLSLEGCNNVDEMIVPHILNLYSALRMESSSALSVINLSNTSVGISNLQTKLKGWKDGETEIDVSNCPVFLNLGGTAEIVPWHHIKVLLVKNGSFLDHEKSLLHSIELQNKTTGRGPVYFGEYNTLLDDTEKGTINFQEFPQELLHIFLSRKSIVVLPYCPEGSTDYVIEQLLPIFLQCMCQEEPNGSFAYILWPVGEEASGNLDVTKIKEKLQEKLVSLRNAGAKEVTTVFSEENLKGANFADQMNSSNLGILHSTLSNYLDPDNKLKDTFFHFLESSDLKLLLKKIVHCQQILDKNVCSAYAEMTKKAERTLAHLEECVRTPGLHRFDSVFNATIEQLLQADVSFKKLKEEAEEDWNEQLLDSESDSDSDSYPDTRLPKEKPTMKPTVPFISQKSAMEKMIDFAFYMGSLVGWYVDLGFLLLYNKWISQDLPFSRAIVNSTAI